jgi:peptidase E
MKKKSILYRIAQGLPLVGVSAIEKIAGRNILHTDLKELQRHCKNKLKKVR